MIHKLLAGKGRMKKAVSLLLCLALLGSSVISTNVTAAETDTDATVVTNETESSSDAANSGDSSSTTEVASNEVGSEISSEDVTENIVTVAGDSDDSSADTGEISDIAENDGDAGISLMSVGDTIDTGDEEFDQDTYDAGGPGGGGGSGSGSTSATSAKVYYDRITTSGSGTNMTIAAQNDSEGIDNVSISGGSATSVTVEGKDIEGYVAQESGEATSWSKDTTSITYTSNTEDTVTITVTPEDGYYITYITVCCTGPNSNTMPTSCFTWQAGSAFEGSYSISNMGTISVNVDLNGAGGFKHEGAEACTVYFVLIATAKIPSPLYVEYDYGDIVNYLSTDNYNYSYFEDPDTWTDTADGNSYGSTGSGESSTNGVQTDDTQYKYTYADDSNSGSAGWYHYANSITDEALAQAAADGYYFVGWLATYYTTCTVENTEDDKGNDWTYTFSSQYGSTSEYYQPNDPVPLTVHVQLVAQWEQVTPTPGTLTIRKTFDGLEESEYPDSITFIVYNSSDEQVESVTLSADSWIGTVENLNPGTYTIMETEGYDDVDGYTCTTTETSKTVTLGYETNKQLNAETNTYTYTVTTTGGSVSFVNTYEKSTTSVTVKKVWSDIEDAYGLRPNSVTVNLLKNGTLYSVEGSSTEYIVELDSDGGWTYTWSGLPIYDDNNTEIEWTVSENDVTYYTSSISEDASVENGTGYIITNKLNTTNVTVIKNVSGNMGDTAKTFEFTYEVTAGTYTVNGSFDLLDYETNNNDSETISGVPVGATITLIESNYEGYTTSVSYTGGSSSVSGSDGTYTITIVKDENQVITVNNDKTAIPDTGINLNSTPYILMLAGVAILGGVVLFRRRRKLL